MSTQAQSRPQRRKADNPGEPVKNGNGGSFGTAPKAEAAPLDVVVLDPQDISDAPYVSPTGVLVYDGEPHTEEWFAARRNGITATDVPKIMGSNKRRNALDVWLDKQGVDNEVEDPELEELGYWGSAMEDPIAARWSDEMGLEVQKTGVIAHEQRPWQRASLDRIVIGCKRGPCSLEIKTRSEYTTGTYEDGRIPRDILDQCEWGRSTAGYSHTHLAVLAGRKFFAFDIEADEERESDMLAAAYDLWQKNLDGEEPHVEPTGDGSLIDTMDRLYPYRSGDRPVDDEKILPLVKEYNEASDVAGAAEKRKTAAKEALIVALDDGDTAIDADGEPLFTYKPPKSSNTMTAAGLKALEKEDPALVQDLRNRGIITLTSSKPRFGMKSKFGRKKAAPTVKEIE